MSKALNRRLSYLERQIRQHLVCKEEQSQEDAGKRAMDIFGRLQLRARAEVAEALRGIGKDVPAPDDVPEITPDDMDFWQRWLRASRNPSSPAKDKEILAERLARYDKSEKAELN